MALVKMFGKDYPTSHLLNIIDDTILKSVAACLDLYDNNDDFQLKGEAQKRFLANAIYERDIDQKFARGIEEYINDRIYNTWKEEGLDNWIKYKEEIVRRGLVFSGK